MKLSTTNVTERRIDSKVRLMRTAAVLCSAFAAVGISYGIKEASVHGGWTVPVLAGIAAATGFGAFWHISIGSVVGMVKKPAIAALFVGAIGVTALALGASAQAIATAVAGRSAISAELSAKVEGYNKALAEAYAEATGWGSIASSAGQKAAGYEKQAETEMTGNNGTGSGCGPRCASLQDISAAFSQAQSALNGLLSEAADIRARGDVAMILLRDAAANGDQPTFMAGAEGVAQAIARLNAVDPRPIIRNTGAVVVSPKGIDTTKETDEFYATADKALAERDTVEAPVFTSMTLGGATRSQMMGSAMHGWILAGAIDVLPLFFLLLAFTLSREVWMQELVNRERLTPEERDEIARRKLDSLHGNVRPNGHDPAPFRAAAE